VRKLSLITKFGVISIVPILLLGLVLAQILTRFVRDRAITSTKRSIQVGASIGIQPHISADELASGFSNAERRELETILGGQSFLEGTVQEYAIFNRDLVQVYGASDDIGSDRVDLETALEGRTTSSLFTRDETEYLSVFVPLRFGTGAPPAGVLEISVPYEPIAKAIRTDARQLLLVLLAGLALLWLALFRIVADASSKLRKQAKTNEYHALHDGLTSLPNRGLFRDRVAQAIALGSRENHIGAVMLMDLDRFKEINDTLGHHKGDIVLQHVAQRLQHSLRETDTVARLGGDEFALLLPNIPGPAAALNVAEKVRESLHQPFVIEGMALDVHASIGIAFFPGHGEDVDLLIQRADVAMYLAKAAHTGCEIYAAERDQYSPNRLALVADMRRAIEHEEFVLFYQPKVDLQTGESHIMEALVRWDHPLRGMIPPNEFIPLAEHTGLIEALTLYVLDKALKQVSTWRDQDVDLTVAVNLSPRNLLDLHFPEHVQKLLTKHRVPPGCLQLEITESTLVADPTRAMGILGRLNQMRVEMSIDDFGTGYSSLAHLRKLPVQELKIDKSFVMNMENDESDAVIVRSTIDLGRNLGLRVVAEGVETAEVYRRLITLGCDYAQGYFRSHPMPAHEVPRWLSLARPRWPL